MNEVKDTNMNSRCITVAKNTISSTFSRERTEIHMGSPIDVYLYFVRKASIP